MQATGFHNVASSWADQQFVSAVSRRFGFALIELLVVISIIVLIIGILLPALSQTRVSAKSLKCMTQQRSIGHGFGLYITDNKDRFPRFNTDPFPMPPAPLPWTQSLVINGYIHGRIFICPGRDSDYVDMNKWQTASAQSYVRESFWSYPDYGYNYLALGIKTDTGVTDYTRSARLEQLRNASEMLVMADSAGTGPNYRNQGSYHIEYISSTAPYRFTYDNIWPTHGTKANILFADTHVQTRSGVGNDLTTIGLSINISLDFIENWGKGLSKMP